MKPDPQHKVDEWNAKHPPGTRVRRYRLMSPRAERAEETITTGKAWILGGHSPVVGLKGLTGPYHLECLEVLP